jgi:dihydrofolate synthase/folylpolyglutamate synthase
MPEAPHPLKPDPAGGELARLAALESRGMKLGLDVIRELLLRLGSPEKRVPRALVGGTNGKGSTAAALAAIFDEAGIPCGLHTSPHLEDVCERVRIAGRDVSPEAFSRALARVFGAADREPRLPVTYFEAVTAAAEVLFETEGCAFAVVEVGLGGRLDATNASDPLLSLVTSIALDHQADLGDSVEAIAREKAGIFRRGAPALCGAVEDSARSVLRAEAEKAGARFVDAAEAVRILPERRGASGAFVLETGRRRYRLVPSLPGAHQRRNAALAVLAAEHLVERFPPLTPEAVERGVASTRWPGRLEPFAAGESTVWLDGCHNPDGARALSVFLRESLAGRYDLLFGAMSDKDIAGIAGEILPGARRVVLTAPRIRRAASPEELRARLSTLRPDLETAPSAGEGLARLLSDPGGTVVVAGSLYLVGEVRGLLRARSRKRAIA